MHWNIYHVDGLRIFGALPSHAYMCPLKFFHVPWLRIVGALPSLPYICLLNLLRGWVENRWTSIFTPLHESTELITWQSREYEDLYLHSPTCVHWTYHVAGLGIGGALPSLPYMWPLNLSRGWVENRWSSNLHSPTCVHWNHHVAGLRIGGALPSLRYMLLLSIL